MTDSTDNAPERIAFRKAYMSHAITSGPLMDHPDYVQYIRADLAPDPQDARMAALHDFFEWIMLHKASILDGMSRREQGEFTEMFGAARAADLGGDSIPHQGE